MYCTYCGSKKCAEGTRLCIMSPQAMNLIVRFLEEVFFETSRFNKSYTFIPNEEWDLWALKNNVPTQIELLELYPEEDLFSLLFLALEDAKLSPELTSFFKEQVNFDESETFSEFFDGVNVNTDKLKPLTREDVLRYNGKKIKNLPRPAFISSLTLRKVDYE